MIGRHDGRRRSGLVSKVPPRTEKCGCPFASRPAGPGLVAGRVPSSVWRPPSASLLRCFATAQRLWQSPTVPASAGEQGTFPFPHTSRVSLPTGCSPAPHPVRPLRGCSQENPGTVCARRRALPKDTPAQSAHLPWRAVPGGTGSGRCGGRSLRSAAGRCAVPGGRLALACTPEGCGGPAVSPRRAGARGPNGGLAARTGCWVGTMWRAAPAQSQGVQVLRSRAVFHDQRIVNRACI
jgi:hypothetical protein